MDWWYKANPHISLEKGIIEVTLNGTVHILDLLGQHTKEEGLSQVNTLGTSDKVKNFNFSEEGESSLELFKPLFFQTTKPIIPDSLHFKINFKPGSDKYFGSPKYALDVLKLNCLQKYIEEKLEDGVIVPSTSSTVSPVILVPRGTGEMRVCIDFRKLNEITETDNLTLPLLEDIISTISGSKVYSKLDLKDAFHQVSIDPASHKYTAFKCKFGVFEYTTMSFGLKNVPLVFQRMIDNTLGSLVGSCCIAYLDNIIVFSPLVEQHKEDLKKAFEALNAQNLHLKPSKCEFFKNKISFLGNIIFENGQEACPDKIKDVLDWKTPSTRSELRSFLGTVNFLRHYIKDLFCVSFPLLEMTSIKIPFSWGEAENASFLKIKEILTSTPVLHLPDTQHPFILETDASDFATGAVLLQPADDGNEYPVDFYSSKMLPAETKYPV